MRKSIVLLLAVLLMWPTGAALGAVSQQGENPQLVYVIPVTGEIDFGLAAFVRRGLTSAERAGAAVLLEINTFGGLIAAAAEIRDA
ncbi:MAG: nodulation protein NfeD, partial [Firmicutes bacterium]|nr:nodulation protein NfeD [Bacillota bacterium]